MVWLCLVILSTQSCILEKRFFHPSAYIGILETSMSKTRGGVRSAPRSAACWRASWRASLCQTRWICRAMAPRTRRALRVRCLAHRGPPLGVSDTPKPLGRRASRSPRKASSMSLPSWMTYDVLLAVVAWPAAPGRGAGAKVATAGSHAVARRMTFGTEAVGFLKRALFGLRAIEHPPVPSQSRQR